MYSELAIARESFTIACFARDSKASRVVGKLHNGKQGWLQVGPDLSLVGSQESIGHSKDLKRFRMGRKMVVV